MKDDSWIWTTIELASSTAVLIFLPNATRLVMYNFVLALLCLTAGVAYWCAATAPQPKASEETRKRAGKDRLTNNEDAHQDILKIRKAFALVSGIVSAVCLATGKLTADQVDALHPWLAIGLLICICGAVFRVWCFRKLDRLFTFELSVQDDHKLIRTGPYKYLAHPSYLGIIAYSTGGCLCLYGPLAPWLYLVPSVDVAVGPFTVSTQATLTFILSALSLTLYTATFIFLIIRIADEEAMLTRHFGAQYKAFLAERWRMVPFVY